MSTPAQLATDIATAVRNLNHATLKPRMDGWEHPGDAHNVIGSLVASTHGLTQTLEQISQLLYDLQATRQIVSVDGAHATEGQVLSARSALRRAREHAAALTEGLGDAHVATSGLAMIDTQEPPR
ncbi:hypothetical protein [Streptomyces sp. NPDC048669]|uniref:hypothetical protein n=1 Tax=Streptomyces sp. NPDC048669 TaxID=3155267 RepID=UPI0034188E7B